MLDDYGRTLRINSLMRKRGYHVDLKKAFREILRHSKRLHGGEGWLLATQADMDRAYSPMTAEEARAFIDGALTPTKGD